MHLSKKNKTFLGLLVTDKELLVNIFVIFIFLFLSATFPAENSAQIITKNIFFLIILPIIYIKIILKKNLTDFGFNLRNKRTAIHWGGGLLAFSLLLFYLFLNYSGFQAGYKLPAEVISSFWSYLLYELIIVNFIFFIHDFFFRGFMLSFFQKKFQYWSILIQAGSYSFVLLLTKSFSWEVFPMILFSITGGILAYKTKSFLYSYFMNFFAIIILDAYIIYLSK